MGWFSTESSYLTSASPQARLPVITEALWPLKAIVNCTGSGAWRDCDVSFWLDAWEMANMIKLDLWLLRQMLCHQAASWFGVEPVLWIWSSVIVPYCRTLWWRLHAGSLKTGWDVTICTTVSGVHVHFLETSCFLSIKLERNTKWIVFLVCHSKGSGFSDLMQQ